MVDRVVLEEIIKEIIAEQLPAPVPQPSLWDKFKAKLSEQGTQRGILAILPLISAQLHLSVEDMVAVISFALGMMGINNIITKG